MFGKKPKNTPVSEETGADTVPVFSVDVSDVPVDASGNPADAGKKIAAALAPFEIFERNAPLSRKK